MHHSWSTQLRFYLILGVKTLSTALQIIHVDIRQLLSEHPKKFTKKLILEETKKVC